MIDRVAGQFGHLGVAQRVAAAQLDRRVDRAHRRPPPSALPARRRTPSGSAWSRAGGARSQLARGQHRLVHVELVRVDRPLHDRLAQPVELVMNTTPSNPDSVSIVNITPDEPRSLRTIRWMPADSATSPCANPLWTRTRSRDRCRARRTRAGSGRAPLDAHTFRNVSCWPANDASGRSSAVADERTANAYFTRAFCFKL